jgi:hypothetical protein
MGIYVDEGYKTLDARNLALFGQVHWNPSDDFAGWWMERSFLTQILYFSAFRLFGAELGTARLVAITFFLLFLASYAVAHGRRYSPSLLCLGAAMLGLQHTLFSYSRVALFMQPAVTLCYFAVFLLLTPLASSVPRALFLTSGLALVASLGVKQSALLYFLPILVGILLSLAVGGRVKRTYLVRAAVLVGGVTVLIAVLTRNSWLWRVDLARLSDFRAVVLNPMTESSSLLVAAGLLAASHAILVMPRRFLSSAYRSSLVLLATLGPLSLILFPYNPLRYYIPFIPSYVLLTVEWFHLRVWKHPVPRRSHWLTTVSWMVLFGWALLCLGKAISNFVLDDVQFWEELKRSGRVLFPWFEMAALVGAWGVWKLRAKLFQGKLLKSLMALIVLLALFRDLHVNSRFLLSPSYRSREVAAELEGLISPGVSMVGDWAPFFALGTEIPALSMGAGSNIPWEVPSRELGAGYFLYNDTKYGKELFKVLKMDKTVRVEPAVFESTYSGFEIALYPLDYSKLED